MKWYAMRTAIAVIGLFVLGIGSAFSGWVTLYEENFDGFSVGGLDGQNGWTNNTLANPQVGLLDGDTLVTGNGISNAQARKLNALSWPTGAYDVRQLVFTAMMRMKEGQWHWLSITDGSGDSIVKFGTGTNYKYLYYDDAGTLTNLGEPGTDDDLSGVHHYYFDVRFTVDFTGASPVGKFETRNQDGDKTYSVIGDNLTLNLTAAHENPTSWVGIGWQLRMSSDKGDDLKVEALTVDPKTETVVLQDGLNGLPAGTIEESMLVQNSAASNYGSRPNCEVGVLNNSQVRTTVMRFDVTNPALGLYRANGDQIFDEIQYMTLTLTTDGNLDDANNMNIRLAANTDAQGDWVEGTANAATQSGSVSFSERREGQGTGWSPNTDFTRGGGAGVLAEATTWPDVNSTFEMSLKPVAGETLTDLVNRWATGENEGILINTSSISGFARWFFCSSENATQAYRPKLTIGHKTLRGMLFLVK